jgi:type IV secretory pathway VirB4 component
MQIETEPKHQIISLLTASINNIKTNFLSAKRSLDEIKEMDLKINKLDELQEGVISDEESIKTISSHIFSFETSLARLQSSNKNTNDFLKPYDLNLSANRYLQEDAFLSILPKPITESTRFHKQIIPASSLAASFPFSFYNIIDKEGFYLGTINKNKGFLAFDIFQQDDQRTNSNMFVIGSSGSGKSFTTKKLLNQLICKNQKIYILDPEREYKSFCERFNGT